jgi:hypothetical protein
VRAGRVRRPGNARELSSPARTAVVTARGESRRGSRWWRAARAAIVVAICLAAMEGATRAVASLSPAVRRLADPHFTWVREPTTFEEFQAAFPEHLVPHRTWYGARCNALGFHDQEFALDLPAGSMRLVALGDSFAFANVPWARAYLTVAEAALRLLGDVGSGRPVTELVIDNLGVAGTGIESYRRVYELVGRALSPDVVLVNVYLGNDTIDFADDARFGGRARAGWSWLWTALSRGFAIRRELARGGLLSAAGATGGGDAAEAPPVGAPGAAGRKEAPLWSDDRPPLSDPVLSDEAFAQVQESELPAFARAGAPADAIAWPEVERALDDLVAAIEADGARPVVVLVRSRLQTEPEELAATARESGTSPDDYDAARPNRWMAEWARRRGVLLVDLRPALADAAARGEGLYLVNDTHWNLRGNGLAGLTLARELVELGVVPRRPGSEGSGGS